MSKSTKYIYFDTNRYDDFNPFNPYDYCPFVLQKQLKPVGKCLKCDSVAQKYFKKGSSKEDKKTFHGSLCEQHVKYVSKWFKCSNPECKTSKFLGAFGLPRSIFCSKCYQEIWKIISLDGTDETLKTKYDKITGVDYNNDGGEPPETVNRWIKDDNCKRELQKMVSKIDNDRKQQLIKWLKEINRESLDEIMNKLGSSVK